MNAYSRVRTHRQNLPSAVRAWASAESTSPSRVHGHTILHEEEVAKTFEVGQRALERLFPGCSVESTEQAALSAGQSGIGFNRSVDVARPAHLGSYSQTLANTTSLSAIGRPS